MQARPR